MNVLRMTDLDIAGKRLLIRQDLNTPLKDGAVADDTRIRAGLDTVKLAVEKGAKVILMSHMGRPKEGEFDESLSLKPVAKRLSELLGQEVPVEKDWLDGVDVEPGKVVLTENTRFLKGEKANDDELGKKMAALCDIFVNDAFAAAHRAQASTHAVARFAPTACAGLLLSKELESLGKALKDPDRPMIALVGGSKVSTKLTLLKNLADKVDKLIPGGGIANTFIAAKGHNVGKSLYEADLVSEAEALVRTAKDAGGEIPVPTDVVCGKELSEDAVPTIKKVEDVADDDMILDIGPETAKRFADELKTAGTIVWNGPPGAFEYDQFGGGTVVVGRAVAESKAFSIVGGGDTVAALEKYNLAEHISYISTGGGAFLEFMEGKTLPAVAVLEDRAKK